jgi:nucleotide-binding universal stress UspA family protein
MSGVVVGVDGSAGSRRALEVALEEAAAHGETLRVVHAYTVSTPRRDLKERLPANVELRQHAQEVVRDLLEEVDGAGRDVDITTEVMAVRDHNVAQALVHASKGASKLVVGSRGLEGFAGLLLGSVSQQCVQHAACPVLVVPNPDERRG